MHPAIKARSASRFALPGTTKAKFIGIRVVRPLDPQSPTHKVTSGPGLGRTTGGAGVGSAHLRLVVDAAMINMTTESMGTWVPPSGDSPSGCTYHSVFGFVVLLALLSS